MDLIRSRLVGHLYRSRCRFEWILLGKVKVSGSFVQVKVGRSICRAKVSKSLCQIKVYQFVWVKVNVSGCVCQVKVSSGSVCHVQVLSLIHI